MQISKKSRNVESQRMRYAGEKRNDGCPPKPIKHT